MPARVRYVIVGVFACVLAALAAVWIAALTESDAVTPDAPAGAVAPPGARVPDFTLRDQDGRAVSPAGELSIYAFVYSTCEDTCPGMTQTVRGALDDLGRDVPVYGISVDPANDTPARAKRFLSEQYMTGRMRFVLGSEDELEPVWRAFGVHPQREGRDHSARVVIVDAEGNQRIAFQPDFLTDDGLLRDLQALGA